MMEQDKFTVTITVPNAGTNVDADLFEAVGRTSDWSGCCMMSGDRDHGWEFDTRREAKRAEQKLQECVLGLSELNGFDIDAAIAVQSPS